MVDKTRLHYEYAKTGKLPKIPIGKPTTPKDANYRHGGKVAARKRGRG